MYWLQYILSRRWIAIYPLDSIMCSLNNQDLIDPKKSVIVTQVQV